MTYYKCGSIYTTQNSNVVVDTASGVIANFQTPLAMPLVKTKFDVNAKQDLHGQSGAYPAGGGINKWDEQWELGAWSSANGGAVNYTDRIRCKNLIPVLPSTSYCIRFGTIASSVVNAYDENGDFIENLTTGTFGTGGRAITTPANCYFIKFSVGTAYGTTYNNDISLNYPSTDTDYHPYSNICPISGVSEISVFRSSKNLLPNKMYQRTVNHIVIGQDNADNEIYLKEGTYTINVKSSLNPSLYLQGDTTSQTSLGSQFPKTFTIDKSEKYRFQVYKSTGITPEDITSFQLELGSTATEYEPYHGNTEVIELGGTYYGGHYTQDKDGHRQFEVTHKSLDWSALNFRWSNNYGNWTNYLFFASVSDMKYNYLQKSDIYEMQLVGNIGDIENYRYRVSFSSSSPYVYFRNDDYTDAEDFATAMNEHQFLYEITEPIVIDLADGTPIKTLPGVNNIFADTGNTSLQFRKIG